MGRCRSFYFFLNRVKYLDIIRLVNFLMNAFTYDGFAIRLEPNSVGQVGYISTDVSFLSR